MHSGTVKAVIVHDKAYEGTKVQIHSFLTLALMEVSGLLHTPKNPSNMRMSEPQSRSEILIFATWTFQIVQTELYTIWSSQLPIHVIVSRLPYGRNTLSAASRQRQKHVVLSRRGGGEAVTR
jgi:hypothetical protein